MLTDNDYKQAIEVQNACNLSGVVRAWSRMLGRIWNDARAINEGTEWVNRHPINVLFASKVASLTGCEASYDGDARAGGWHSVFSEAYDFCLKRSEKDFAKEEL